MTLSIASGAFYFLTGPSGSGKTTFLKMCYGALVPTAGNITIFGQDLRAMTRDDIALTRRRIGVVHQDCQFLDHLNVVDNIALPLAAGRYYLPHSGDRETGNLDAQPRCGGA